jgi:Glycosyltransferase family 92
MYVFSLHRFSFPRVLSIVVIIALVSVSRLLVYRAPVAGDNATDYENAATVNRKLRGNAADFIDKSNVDSNEDSSTQPRPNCILPGTEQSEPKLRQNLDDGFKMCMELQRPSADVTGQRQSKWQRHDSRGTSIVVYSAFYDDRPAVGMTPWIRIQGVASVVNMNTTKFYCHIWYNDCQSPYVVEAVSKVAGRDWGYSVNKVRYIQFMFSCRLLGTEPIPTHISLVANDQCSNTTICLPVERSIRSEPDHQFGVCVAIAFGHIPAAEFIEWIELNRMFGVTEFNVYDGGMLDMGDVFDYYTKKGILKVHSMPPPVIEKPKATTLATPVNGSVSFHVFTTANNCNFAK